jgi:hypothetical protein
MVARDDVTFKLTELLQHRPTLNELVAWAEGTMMEAEFDEKDMTILSLIIGRIGLLDVREFRLSWEEIEQFFSLLVYRARIDVSRVP